MEIRKWEHKTSEIAHYMRLIKNLNQANLWADQTQRDRERIHLCGEWEMSNGLYRENQATYCQEIEELRRRCCEETDRARQPRTDELSMHQPGDPNTVSQLLTQIRSREGPSQALFENSKNLASSSRGMRPEFSGENIVPEMEVRRGPQSSSLPVRRFQSGGRPESISNDVGGFWN